MPPTNFCKYNFLLLFKLYVKMRFKSRKWPEIVYYQIRIFALC